MKGQCNVVDNGIPINEDKIATCYQILRRYPKTTRIQNTQSKFEKIEFKHKQSERLVAREPINWKEKDECVKENDKLGRNVDVKGRDNITIKDAPIDDVKLIQVTTTYFPERQIQNKDHIFNHTLRTQFTNINSPTKL